MATTSVSPGETNLQTLLSSLIPNLHPSIFVFLTFPPLTMPPPTLTTIMTFREIEGLTIITTLEEASSHNLDYVFPSRMITLDIHSSLEAVGFMAVISKALAENGIGCNPVSGFFHDHCFVPAERGDDAVKVLRGLAERAKEEKAEVQ